MARTPIPPRASAVRNRSKSEHRSRCAMLTFSGFLPPATGTVGLVLTARMTQRYRIFARSTTPAPQVLPDLGPHPHFRAREQHSERPRIVVDAEHGGYTVASWGTLCTPFVD